MNGYRVLLKYGAYLIRASFYAYCIEWQWVLYPRAVFGWSERTGLFVWSCVGHFLSLATFEPTTVQKALGGVMRHVRYVRMSAHVEEAGLRVI